MRLAFFVGILAVRCDEKRPDVSPDILTIGRQGTHDTYFYEPRAVAVSRSGKLFVADRTGRVQRFNSAGGWETSWRIPDLQPNVGQPSGICADNDDRILVADTHRNRVLAFDEDGRELFRFGERGTGPGQFMFPTDVAVDSEGAIYVAEFGGNDRISKFNRAGEFLLAFGGIDAGLAALQHPSGIAVDAADNLWIADAGNHRICCFRSDGSHRKCFGDLGSGPGQLKYPRDVTLLPSGDLIVADAGNNRLNLLASGGAPIACWGQAGRGIGGLHEPLNVAVAGDRVYIADSRNHRVVALQLEALINKAGTPIAQAKQGRAGS